MARDKELRALKRTAEDIDDALELYRPFIAPAESDAWRQVHALLQVIGRFAQEANAPEAVWQDVEDTLHEVHEALLAAVARGRKGGREATDPAPPPG
ncbi:hypothetical protein [Reyranella sp. CPCC 100927]|uniref:hypothetical protein n=1 Tax=Reyranella sp. CPCC 100927 TaxID=2599616 RepID=UPI0011B58950|nr:hypothetical protein [Reyranella sp. CPCC 100927]TWS99461.1 hypothetical protein FQU96_35455 [Reyranella sp. CPCC 100927]